MTWEVYCLPGTFLLAAPVLLSAVPGLYCRGVYCLNEFIIDCDLCAGDCTSLPRGFCVLLAICEVEEVISDDFVW
jgi:hypothetical protein